MVRERKKYDIEKIHKLIDSASLPKNKNTTLYNDKNLELLLNRLSDEQSKSKNKVRSSNLIHTKSESLKPQVVVHKREDIQKKEERVIQIELGPKAIKKQKEHAIASFAHPRDYLFAEESLYEIEKVVFLEEEPEEMNPTDMPKKSEVRQEFMQVVSDWEHKEKHRPEWEPVTKETTEKEIIEVKKGKSIEMLLPEFERVEEKQSPLPSLSPEKENRIPSFEPVEFKAVGEKQQVERLEVRKKEKAELLPKKLEEKQLRQEAKEKEREAKRLAKKHGEKLQFERLEIQKKQQEEQKQINDVVRIAVEAKERRKHKAFKRKSQKEGKKQRKKKRN